MPEFDADVPMPDLAEEDVEEEEKLKRCRTDRDKLSNKETATCAGVELKETYENEEVGGT